MKSYNQFVTNKSELHDYNEAIRILEIEGMIISEGVLDKLSGGVKKKIEFIKSVAATTKSKLSDLLVLFKNTKVFNFFSQIGFSFKKLFKMIKKGFDGYKQMMHVVADFVASSKGGKWTEKKLRELDKYLVNHPILKKMGGPVVSGMLLYIWLNMSFTGDLQFDMNFDDMLLALAGKFELAKLFAGPEGLKMLMLFVTGIIGLSFPWPSSTSVHFVGGVVASLAKFTKIKIGKEK